ncbi:response regulator transcription factor [Noviherbaspirillum denitrificans]|uniref:Two-component system response regulator n=1 Tax=Noviherbaspirillum denitrificans TaxID=1968433 RepID=A0A254TNT5_9BURK|nr:response regulator transcription factor [Noviherbaspirillum denitrificans]OWW22283.1 two-component system response regulator [Noviherbaspirillum denitrificans]
MHILLVEDDRVLADGVARILNGHGMVVDVATNGIDADNILQRSQADVVVLDIGIPGIDGFEVVRRLRERANSVPVLLLTARDAVDDRVRGLELGADDYLVKPFAPPELVARIKALARRAGGRKDELSFKGLSLDQTTKRARVNGQPIELSAREWAVLQYLLQQASRVVSKEQILNAVVPWGEELTLNAVEVYVSRVRLKIAGSGVAIRTIRGFGYMLEELPA